MAENLIDITGLNSDFAFAELWPFMVHPADVERRECLTAVMVAKCKLMLEPDKTLEYLLIAAEKTVLEDERKGTASGRLAGEVFLTILEMHSGGIKNAGIDKACHLVSRLYHRRKDQQGKTLRAGRNTVADSWTKYRDVVHLWASLLILQREAETNGVVDDASMWLDGVKLASIANSLKQTAFPLQSAPILLDTSFEISGVPIVALTAPGLSSYILDGLKDFTPRYRGTS